MQSPAFNPSLPARRFWCCVNLVERALQRRSQRLIGATQENFKKSSSKRITVVDNAIMAS